MLGLAAVVLARRLHVFRALPGPSWYFPDPDLSESITALQQRALTRLDTPALPGILSLCRRLLSRLGRWRPVPRCLVPLG